MMDWSPLILTFKLAIITTIILFLISVPLAFWLASTSSRSKPIIETLVSMPLVLPPTVIGFYLLVAFSPSYAIGSFLERTMGFHLVFSFEGIVLGSIIYSLPFMVHPIQSGISNLPKSLSEASFVLGKSRWTTLIMVLLPNIKTSIVTGIVLAFAHTIGEFGVILMIGGNIPDETRVASIAIYDQVEALNYDTANQYSLFLFIVTFVILLTVFLINGGYIKHWR
ncbi:MAG: molybdate ABC transporter permease subunit [Saprospiraceae bacterium]|nr:molybdate ABC transporter permease subunit [Saprospiraceae bacterium]